MDKWKGKIAVVTGGSSGIGASVSQLLLNHGVIVIILDMNPTEGQDFHFFQCNIADGDSIKKTFALIEEKFKFVHILINCAGITRMGSILDDSDETTQSIDAATAVNFSGTVHVARAAYKLIKKSDDYGLIVNICSVQGHSIQYPNRTMTYPSTKFAVRAFSETLRQELVVKNDDKVRVSNLSPG